MRSIDAMTFTIGNLVCTLAVVCLPAPSLCAFYDAHRVPDSLEGSVENPAGHDTDQTPTAAPDPLEQVVQGMRAAGEQIGNRRPSRETIAIQDDVIRYLDALIERASQSQSSPSPQDSSQNGQGSNAPTPQSGQQPGASKGSEPEADLQQTLSRGSDSSDTDSANRLDSAEKQAAELANRGRLINDVWGHLPPALRNRLLNADREKFLPKYADEVRRYFEALAEQSRRDAGGSRLPDSP